MKKNAKAANPFAGRLAAFCAAMEKKNLDAAVVCDRSNIRGLTGIDCDSAALVVRGGKPVVHTDFRYVPEIERTAPWIAIGDIKRLDGTKPFPAGGRPLRKVGCEFSVPHSRFIKFRKAFPGAEFEDVGADARALRAVKTPSELEALRKAALLNDEIWAEASAAFKPGMTEIEMARAIKILMIERGEGEAFETIVCIGPNAAECHHTPDGTKWNGRDPILVDMGVRLGGYCSDMTRNIVPAKPSSLYRKAYSLVLEANRRAAAALKPGMTGRQLDAVARRFLAANGFKKEFGHSLGHGVGIEIHEKPAAGSRSADVLEPGMTVTIEPGVYIPGKLGVRIEDLALVTEDGCEILTTSPKALLQ